MNAARTIGANGREKIPTGQTDESIFHFAAITSEEDGAVSWTVGDAEDVTLFKRWAKGDCSEWKVVRFFTAGVVGN